MLGVSQRAYARHRRCTHRAVQKAVASGRIPVLADGSIDIEAADRAWSSNTDESKSSNTVSGEPHHRRPAGGPPVPAGTQTGPRSQVNGTSAGGQTDAERTQSTTAAGYTAARALRETFAARRERLKYEREAGQSVSVDEVKDAAFATARRVRDLLLALPDRVSPVLAATDDATKCHAILTDEIRRTLEELNQ